MTTFQNVVQQYRSSALPFSKNTFFTSINHRRNIEIAIFTSTFELRPLPRTWKVLPLTICSKSLLELIFLKGFLKEFAAIFFKNFGSPSLAGGGRPGPAGLVEAKQLKTKGNLKETKAKLLFYVSEPTRKSSNRK